MSAAILNPEPGRFICRGPGARVNADVLAGFERDRGLMAVVLDAKDLHIGRPLADLSCRAKALLIRGVDVIIDVIP